MNVLASKKRRAWHGRAVRARDAGRRRVAARRPRSSRPAGARARRASASASGRPSARTADERRPRELGGTASSGVGHAGRRVPETRRSGPTIARAPRRRGSCRARPHDERVDVGRELLVARRRRGLRVSSATLAVGEPERKIEDEPLDGVGESLRRPSEPAGSAIEPRGASRERRRGGVDGRVVDLGVGEARRATRATTQPRGVGARRAAAAPSRAIPRTWRRGGAGPSGRSAASAQPLARRQDAPRAPRKKKSARE